MRLTKNLHNKIGHVIYEREGKLTRELKLEKAGFGLGHLPQRLLPQKAVDCICGYCSTGCSLRVHIKDEQPVNVTATTNYPVNLGHACPKGWEALAPLNAHDRAITPYRRSAKKGTLKPVSWNTALEEFTKNFKSIQEKYGEESIAFLSTGQICTEEMALLGALTKFGMGIVHGDGNTRQCMSSAAVAYKQSFGFDAPPYTYNDFEESDVLVFVGANPCIAHPIMWERVCMNKHNPEIIVVDPRKTETAMAATRHYAVKPKSDLSLCYGVARILIENNWIHQPYIKRFTHGFAEFKEHVKKYTLEYVSSITGLAEGDIYELAYKIHKGKRVSFWWTMGVNQSHQGVRTAQALINLALMTGNMGRPGTGANSITGQCNAMGSRLFSNTTNLLGGHDFLNKADRAKIATILEIETENIPDRNSWSYDKIIEGIAARKIKGLWVIGTNPLHSWINRSGLPEIMENLEYLVVQDMYHTTDTAQHADLLLPAAGWGEKEGTVINSERRIGRFRKIAKAPGLALADFYIFKLIAEKWGCGALFKKWSSPEGVFQILKEISRGTPCDITGINDYEMIERTGGIQWPFAENTLHKEHERRLFEDGTFFHPDGKARFIFETSKPLPEGPSQSYPFILLTGRSTSAQWHTQTRTSKSPILRKLYSRDVYVEINPEDAENKNIHPNEEVFVYSARGKISARVMIVPTIKQGQVFMPMHYRETNKLTLGWFDPYSHQPAYKACAVNVTPKSEYYYSI